MGKLSLAFSGDTREEILEQIQTFFGISIVDNQTGVITTATQAPTKTRKTKAEAPAPIQPGAQPPPAGTPQPLMQQPVPQQPIGQPNGQMPPLTNNPNPFMAPPNA